MPHGHKLVSQAMSGNISLDTLGASTALFINTAFGSIEQSFLMKRVRYFMQLTGRTINDDGPILLGICHGDATVGEVANALLEGNTKGLSDITETLTQDNAWVVYENTVRVIRIAGDGTEGIVDDGWQSFGGRNGIPAIEGSGWKWFVFNAGQGALTTGSAVNGIAQIQGVWLRD